MDPVIPCVAPLVRGAVRCLGRAAALALLTVGVQAEEDSLYRRSLERALDVARRELVASRDLYTDHSSWNNAWIVESEHYSVRTTRSRYLAAKTARDLEFMLAQFQFLLGSNHTPRRRYPIWILPSLQAYNEQGGNADEHSSFYGSFVDESQEGRPVITYETPNEKLLGMWITHSAAHQFIQDAFGTSAPTWISEGLASYFSLFWDWQWGAQRLSQIIRERRYVRLEELRDAPLSSYLRNPEERLVVLGMFFNYLLNYYPETRLSRAGDVDAPAPFAEFLQRAVRGRSTRTTAFNRLFAEQLDQLEAEFRGFEFGG